MKIIIDRMAYDPQLKWEGLPQEKKELKKIIEQIAIRKNKKTKIFGWTSHDTSFPHEIYNFSEKLKKDNFVYGCLSHLYKSEKEMKLDAILLCMKDITDNKWKFIGFYYNVIVNKKFKDFLKIEIKKEFYRNLKNAYSELGIDRPKIPKDDSILDILLKAEIACKFKIFLDIEEKGFRIGNTYKNKDEDFTRDLLQKTKEAHEKDLNEKYLNEIEKEEYKEIIKNIENFLEKINDTEERKKMEENKKILENHKQIIFYGPPGTGKTREAKRLAYQIITGKELDSNKELEDILKENKKEKKQFEDQCRIVVFHPSYEYDDFMIGIKPEIKSGNLIFEKKEGIFYNLCKKAEENKDKKYVLIIDEINR